MQATLTQFDLYLIAEGTHMRAYDKLGAHLGEKDGRRGVHFAVWAPNAQGVSIVGDFNDWNVAANAMVPRASQVFGKDSCPILAPDACTNIIWFPGIVTTKSKKRTHADSLPRFARTLPHESGISKATRGGTGPGWQTAQSAIRFDHRFPSTKFTSVRGDACRKRTTAG